MNKGYTRTVVEPATQTAFTPNVTVSKMAMNEGTAEQSRAEQRKSSSSSSSSRRGKQESCGSTRPLHHGDENSPTKTYGGCKQVPG
jgi:hypothetical protein